MATRTVDLRSDTVTKATDKMRLAMQQAEVGDSIKGDDPSVNRLQEMSAAMLGKEAGIYLPSGTMSNLTAIMVHCRRGEEAIVGTLSHIVHGELDGVTALAGVMPKMVPDQDGIPSPADVEAAIRPRSGGRPHTALVCLENTHNWAGGAVSTPEEMGAVASVARKYGLPVHVDGARLFNAAVALKVEARELVREVDSVCFCLSKGLAAPLGSVLVGSKEFIAEAGYIRKMLGGGMRQAGHMAAAGIVALEEMIDRLEEDHQHARYLAELLVGVPLIQVDPSKVETNLVFMDLDQDRTNRSQFVKALEDRGVLCQGSGMSRVRMVTHHGVSREDVEFAAQTVRDVLEEARA